MDIGDMDMDRSTSCWWILISCPRINQINCKSLFSKWWRTYFYWNILVDLNYQSPAGRSEYDTFSFDYSLITEDSWHGISVKSPKIPKNQTQERETELRSIVYMYIIYSTHFKQCYVWDKHAFCTFALSWNASRGYPRTRRAGWNMREAEMGLGRSQGEIPVNARPSQLWKSAIGYASIQPGRYTLPSAGVCSLNSARLIRIYLTSVGRHLHSLQNCTNNSRAQAAVRTKGTFNGKRGRTRVRGIAMGK